MSAEVAALELRRPKYQDERPDVELPEVGGGTVGLASLARASSAASEPDEAAPPLSPRAVEGEGGGLAFQPDSGRVELTEMPLVSAVAYVGKRWCFRLCPDGTLSG